MESELTVARGPLRDALAAHEAVAARLAGAPGGDPLKLAGELAVLADRVERLGGWDTAHEARRLLDRLGVKEWDRPLAELSGGTRKRVAVARALLSRPDLLMLDEPTNHLDADTVEWLEEELDTLPGALLLVTHDRYFLDGLVDRIVEIEPGGKLTSYPGNYESFLEQKLVALGEAEVKQHKRNRWIAGEVAWLRKGPEARRTKSKARIERARKALADRGFKRPSVVGFQAAVAPRLSHTVLEAKEVSKSFGGARVLDRASLIVQKGERIGLVGPNGVGKTTFLRVLLGELAPDEGAVVTGNRTRVAYYDQQRQALDLDQTVYEAAWDDDWVTLGDRKVALRDYLDDLLFPVPMQRMSVRALSGGERNRLLLARLFLEGANVLVLDEPTNDLDIVTLNVLEGLILAFPGAVLLVTHDRYFLDKVATTLLVFEGAGRVVRYEGNYDTYRRLRAQVAAPVPVAAEPRPVKARVPTPGPTPKRKLSFKEQRELESMEVALEAAEARQGQVEAALADPAVYRADPGAIPRLTGELYAARAEVERLYARWQVLQTLAE